MGDVTSGSHERSGLRIRRRRISTGCAAKSSRMRTLVHTARCATGACTPWTKGELRHHVAGTRLDVADRLAEDYERTGSRLGATAMSFRESWPRWRERLRSWWMRSRLTVLVCAVIAAALLPFWLDGGAVDEVASQSALASLATEGKRPTLADLATASQNLDSLVERWKKAAVGTWERWEYGRRVLTVHEDGTATLRFYPDFLARWKYGFADDEHLEVHIEWSFEGERIHFVSVSGTPAEIFKAICRERGDRSTRIIRELNDERFVMTSEDGKTVERWQRLSE